MFVRLAAILTIAVVMFVLWTPGFAFNQDPRELSKVVTSTLDNLLDRSRYDKRIRPDFGGPPAIITVNMHIKSMGPVSETDQNYVMDCYFRQTWYDRRLVFNYTGQNGYTTNDVTYVWDYPKKVGVEPDVELSQYELVNITTEIFPKFKRGVDEYSMLKVEFHMRRNIGYFVLQLYVPCGLIVCCSWVSFWIDPDAVPARVTLGVTTVLSMTTMGFGGRAQMPRVSYATALDSFVIICFSFVFAVIIEYAAINFIDKVRDDLKKILQDKGVKKTSPPKASPDPIDPNLEPRSVSMINMSSSSAHIYNEIGEPGEDKEDPNRHLSPGDARERRKSLVSLAAPFIDSLKKNIERRKSEISMHLPPIPLLMRRKSEASINKPPIPMITVTGNEDDIADEEVRAELQNLPDDDVINIGSDEVFEEEGEENDDDDDKEDGKCLSFVAFGVVGFCKCVTMPWRIVRDTKCLPTEDEVHELILSGETREKFSRIDIESRKYFPICFCVLIVSYWVAYMYYITDDFPAKELHPLLLKSKCHV
ncbi:hypothetical protein C0J52_09672 [Blattella germanica]|nr:hypothetical protein C0J52_09672 [Blattella germanica]